MLGDEPAVHSLGPDGVRGGAGDVGLAGDEQHLRRQVVAGEALEEGPGVAARRW